MPLIREFALLTRRTWILWRRFLPEIATWLLLGWLIYISCLLTSATLGTSFGPLGAIVFVLGVTASVVSVIFAIHSVKPGLETAGRLSETSSSFAPLALPPEVFATERKIDVAILAIGPVLGVYAAWSIIDGMISDGLLWNAVVRSVWGFDEFSIGDRVSLRFYVVLGLVGLVTRLVYGRLVTRLRSPWWKLPLIFLEGLWVFATFFIVLRGLGAFQIWLAQRAFWRNTLHGWHSFLELLPDIGLPFNITLPEALQDVSIWLTESFLPGLWQGVALPMVWLAIAAIVFGWRNFRARDLFTSGLRERAERFEATHPARGGVNRVAGVLATDLREKWLPLLHASRLIWRSGPHVLGSYLLLSALLGAVSWLLNALLARLFASGTQERALRAFNANDVIQHVIITSISVCLYAATFDRGLATAAGLSTDGVRAVAPAATTHAPGDSVTTIRTP